MRPVSSWGRLSCDPQQTLALHDPRAIAGTLRDTRPGVAFGMGRSYGDACLNPGGSLWLTRGLDHLIAYDSDRGVLTCEPGMLLRDIQRLTIADGWLLPVTPGTQVITVGGAIANDVHGKNHHRLGSFGDHVRRLWLARTDGETIECGPALAPDWFAATVGGIGLTGLIVRAELQLRRVPGPWLQTETISYGTLDEFFTLADASEDSWEHTVSWVDCLARGGRGLFMRGNHADVQGERAPSDRARRIPLVPPVSLVNRLSLRPFNEMYFRLNSRQTGLRTTHYEPFFYPLDNLHDWNRMYGPRGFYQYQSVVPRSVGRDAVAAMLAEIGRSGEGSFLAVLKTFGERHSVGMLGFPGPGVTLALDFPNKGASTLALLDRLDVIVGEACGRLYLAKDARMPRALFEAGYPRWREFNAYRDPGISSAMSRRLLGA